jgi:hypothetical protein
MKAPEESFQTHLRQEVEVAGQRYEQAVNNVFALIGRPDVQLAPELLNATEELSEDLRLYTGALRRMANFTANRTPLEVHA